MAMRADSGIMEARDDIRVINTLGVHARPASMIVETALKFQSNVYIQYKGNMVNAKSIMGLLTLGAAQGSQLTVICTGPDAQDALEAIRQLFASGFGEA